MANKQNLMYKKQKQTTSQEKKSEYGSFARDNILCAIETATKNNKQNFFFFLSLEN